MRVMVAMGLFLDQMRAVFCCNPFYFLRKDVWEWVPFLDVGQGRGFWFGIRVCIRRFERQEG